MKKIIWAIIPARSGSKGLKNKNILPLNGKELFRHTLDFAKSTKIFDRILFSTDSKEYAEIAKNHGAWVPFLRSIESSKDESMEEEILEDIKSKILLLNVAPPEIIVWLRPTFPFRNVLDLKKAIELLSNETDSVRLITTSDPRLYEIYDGHLIPYSFENSNSMVRRQLFPETYNVYHTDIFWFKNIEMGNKFLGKKVKPYIIHKICGFDIDTLEDFEIIEALMKSENELIIKYSH